MRYELMFEVQVLRQKHYATKLSREELAFIRSNATYIHARDLWLFEGEFSVFADEELRNFKVVKADLRVPSFGEFNDVQLAELVKDVQ